MTLARPIVPQRRTVALWVAPVLLGVGAWMRRWTADDGFINYRIVDQLLHGHGFVYNAGERIEAGTSPLWIALLSAGRVITGSNVDIAWLGVLLGIGFSVFGLVAAQRAALALHPGHVDWPIPVGALVIAVQPAMWDFATSGLETGVQFAWLGSCGWLLARRARGVRDGDVPSALRSWPGLVLIGLAPLVRPDFAIYAVGLLTAWVLLSRPGKRLRIGAIGVALVLPTLYQLFRMAYFGLLVPNTALAKEAGRAEWARGIDYVLDFVRPNLLVIPLAVLIYFGVTSVLRPARQRHDRAVLVVLGGIVIPAALHVIYVVRVGGDFMHGRFLLAPLFALALPVAIVPAQGWTRDTRAAAGVLAAWLALSMILVFVPQERTTSAYGVTDERSFWVGVAGVSNPVTIDDFAGSTYAAVARRLAASSAHGDDVLIVPGRPDQELADGAGVVATYGSIGIIGFAAGPDVDIVDRLGLSDPIAARLEATDADTRAGHLKPLPDDWLDARFGPADQRSAGIDAARHALTCPDLAELTRSTRDPLSADRLLANLRGAVHSTRVRIPQDPFAAEARFCP